MNYAFHPEALQEYLDGVSYYAQISPHLAEAFILDAEGAIERILTHPRAWPVPEDDVRRCLLKRFPFAIYYCIEDARRVAWRVQNRGRVPGRS